MARPVAPPRLAPGAAPGLTLCPSLRRQRRPHLRARGLLAPLPFRLAAGAFLGLGGALALFLLVLSLLAAWRQVAPLPLAEARPSAVLAVLMRRNGAGVEPVVIFLDRAGRMATSDGRLFLRLEEEFPLRTRLLWEGELAVRRADFARIPLGPMAGNRRGVGFVGPRLAFREMLAWPDDDAPKHVAMRFLLPDGEELQWDGSVYF